MACVPTDAIRGPRVLDGERAPLTIGLLIVVSAVAFEAMAVATVLPVAARQLGWPELYGWSFSSFMLTSLVTTIAASQRADRAGPLAPYLAGIALFAGGLVLAGTAPSMPVFIAGRALQGCGAGCISGLAYLLIGRGYPDALRARMLALLSSAWVVPALVGPALAGMTADRFTWRAVFIGLLPLLGLAGALMWSALRHMIPVEGHVAPPSRLGTALRLAAGTGLALAGLDVRPLIIGVPIVVAGLAVAFPAVRGLLPAGTLTARPGLPAALAARGMLTFGFFGAEAFVPLGLTSLRGQTVAQAGIALTASALTWTAGAWIQARLDRNDSGRGRTRRVTAGVALVFVGGSVMAAGVLADGLPVAVATAGWGLAGLGIGLAYPSISLIVLGLASRGEEGAASGALTVAEVLSVAVSTGLGGAAIALAHTMHWTPAWGIAAAYAIAGLGATAGLVAARRATGGGPISEPSGLLTEPARLTVVT